MFADAGRMADAIAMLEAGPVDVRRPQEHHLRLWYALAAMYERAGYRSIERYNDNPYAERWFAKDLD